MKLTSKRRELIAAVRTHAEENYDRGGWDVIVECWDDEQIAEQVGRARTLKGALAKFSHLIDVWSDRQAEAACQAVGAPDAENAGTAHYVIPSTSLYPYNAMLDCSCGGEFFTEKAADLHAAERNKALGCYDATAQGHHPDGSFVSWGHDEHSGYAWATRTWDGKGGRGHIEIVETEGGYEVVERYAPGWRGVLIYGAGYCDYDPSVPF